MNLNSQIKANLLKAKPRSRGDEPVKIEYVSVLAHKTPLTRG